MEWFLSLTAWPMETPSPYSAFHLLLSAFLLPAAGLAAWRFRKLSERKAVWLLFFLGLFLGITEIYKQLFLYYIENGRHYNWWYFPFQLCSLPMYLCILLPFLRKKGRTLLFTFMYQYNLLGALLVFAVPSGLMHPYWTLTLHGFLWHGVLVFIGLFLVFSHRADRGNACFFQSTALFLLCCAVATAVNVAARFLSSPPYWDADMFYLSPFYPNVQIVFHQIGEAAGTFVGNLAYILSIIAGAFLMKRIS